MKVSCAAVLTSAMLLPSVALATKSTISGLKVAQLTDEEKVEEQEADELADEELADEESSMTSSQQQRPPLGINCLLCCVPLDAFFRKNRIRRIGLHANYRWIMLAVTVFNVVVMATDYEGISSTHFSFMNTANYVCTLIFVVDIVFRLIGQGWHLFKDKFQVLDFVLVLVSIPDIPNPDGGGSSVSALRALRILRVLRMLPYFPSLKKLVGLIFKSLASLGALTLLVSIIVFVFSVLGTQLFHGVHPERRDNFNTIADSVLSVFIVISGDNWTEIMQETTDGVGNDFAVIYFILLYLIGNILLNVFIAVLIGSFSSETVSEGKEAKPALMPMTSSNSLSIAFSETQAEEMTQLDKRLRSNLRVVEGASEVLGAAEPRPRKSGNNDLLSKRRLTLGDSKNKVGSSASLTSLSPTPIVAANVTPVEARLMSPHQGALTRKNSMGGASTSSMARTERRSTGSMAMAFSPYESTRSTLMVRLKKILMRESETVPSAGNTVFCIPPGHAVRRFCEMFVLHPLWAPSVVLLVIINAIFLAVEYSPVRDTMSDVIAVFDVIFAVFFTIEMLMQCVVVGFWRDKNAYLRDPWNVIDAIVVVVSIVSFWVVALKSLRCLRTLRLLTHVKEIKTVVSCLVKALPHMTTVGVIVVLLFSIFAILGVGLFKGAYYECSNPDVGEKKLCVGPWNETVTDAYGEDEVVVSHMAWTARPLDFNHFGNAMLTLIAVAIGDNWSEVMYHGIDSQGAEMGPKRNARRANALYFVIFVIVGQFFLVNLFIGVLIDQYREMRKSSGGSLFLTPQQHTWVISQKVLHRTKLSPVLHPFNRSRLSRFCFKLTNNDKFEIFVSVLIVANAVVMSLNYRGMPNDMKYTVDTVNFGFTILFVLECILRLWGLGPIQYFKDSWFRFDFVVSFFSFIATLAWGEQGTSASAARVLRIGRLTRVLNKASDIKQLFSTILLAFPSMMNIGLLLLVLYFVFGIIGVAMFNQTAKGRHSNFEYFFPAMVTLYQITTTDAWGTVLEEVSVAPPDCDPDVDCGQPLWVSYIYMYSFVVVVSFVLVNMFITVLLEHYEDSEDAMTNEDFISLFDRVREVWLHHDRQAKGFLDPKSVIAVCKRLPLPLWVPFNPNLHKSQFLHVLWQLEVLVLPINRQREVRYAEFTGALALTALDLPKKEAYSLSRLSVGPTFKKHIFTLHQFWAVEFIHCWWYTHRFKMRERLLKRMWQLQTAMELAKLRAELDAMNSVNAVTTLIGPSANAGLVQGINSRRGSNRSEASASASVDGKAPRLLTRRLTAAPPAAGNPQPVRPVANRGVYLDIGDSMETATASSQSASSRRTSRDMRFSTTDYPPHATHDFLRPQKSLPGDVLGAKLPQNPIDAHLADMKEFSAYAERPLPMGGAPAVGHGSALPLFAPSAVPVAPSGGTQRADAVANPFDALGAEEEWMPREEKPLHRDPTAGHPTTPPQHKNETLAAPILGEDAMASALRDLRRELGSGTGSGGQTTTSSGSMSKSPPDGQFTMKALPAFDFDEEMAREEVGAAEMHQYSPAREAPATPEHDALATPHGGNGFGEMEEATPEPTAPILRAKAALHLLHERLWKLM